MPNGAWNIPTPFHSFIDKKLWFVFADNILHLFNKTSQKFLVHLKKNYIVWAILKVDLEPSKKLSLFLIMHEWAKISGCFWLAFLFKVKILSKPEKARGTWIRYVVLQIWEIFLHYTAENVSYGQWWCKVAWKIITAPQEITQPSTCDHQK